MPCVPMYVSLLCTTEVHLLISCSSPCHAEYVASACPDFSILTLRADYAITNNLTPFISMQNHHNLLYREEEREMFPTLKVLNCSHCLYTC